MAKENRLHAKRENTKGVKKKRRLRGTDEQTKRIETKKSRQTLTGAQGQKKGRRPES